MTSGSARAPKPAPRGSSESAATTSSAGEEAAPPPSRAATAPSCWAMAGEAAEAVSTFGPDGVATIAP
ncbi:hypothetical protein [Actinomadura welshii]|uniref:hypothetical protein n=1 Tax=Actinomadura welshii TaxID=3103817 RepID=UPI0013770BC7|nr:hypothetical protein [Actinomadura madurae]